MNMIRVKKQVTEKIKEQILEAKIKEEVRRQLEEFGVVIEKDKKIPQILTLEQAKKRDYIVRTKYYGKIVDPAIKKDFKAEIETTFRNNFDAVCNNILNYNFHFEDGVHYCKDVLGIYYNILEQFECKQFVLDVYGKK